MTATITTVPVTVPALWALATILFALYGNAYVWSMIKEKEVIKSMEASYGS